MRPPEPLIHIVQSCVAKYLGSLLDSSGPSIMTTCKQANILAFHAACIASWVAENVRSKATGCKKVDKTPRITGPHLFSIPWHLVSLPPSFLPTSQVFFSYELHGAGHFPVSASSFFKEYGWNFCGSEYNELAQQDSFNEGV